MKWQADSQILIQGMTNTLGIYYASRMKAKGTNIVAGISCEGDPPELEGIPVFSLVEEAVEEVGDIEISLIFTPPYEVLDAGLEAIAAGIRQLVIVTSGVPPLDMVKLLDQAKATNTFILGSGSEGLLVPDKFWLGIMEPDCYTPGSIGLISRCDRLIDEVARDLTLASLGQSLAISLGSDGIIGSDFEQWLQIMEEDDTTEIIVLLGQPNSSRELLAAAYIESAIEKPIIAYIPGIHGPINHNFGDTTEIITSQLSYKIASKTTENQTIATFKKAGVKVAQSPSEVTTFVKRSLSRRKSRSKRA